MTCFGGQFFHLLLHSIPYDMDLRGAPSIKTIVPVTCHSIDITFSTSFITGWTKPRAPSNTTGHSPCTCRFGIPDVLFTTGLDVVLVIMRWYVQLEWSISSNDCRLE